MIYTTPYYYQGHTREDFSCWYIWGDVGRLTEFAKIKPVAAIAVRQGQALNIKL
jgi:hypothetical protein